MAMIENWRNAWRMFSVQAFAVAGTIPSVWLAVPDDMKASVPAEYVMYATIVVVVLGVIGRLTAQPNV